MDFWILVDFILAGVPILVEHWRENNFWFYPSFALFSTLEGMNLDHDFFQVSKLRADQKKVFTKISRGFFPNSSDSHADHSQIIGVDADVDLSQKTFITWEHST